MPPSKSLKTQENFPAPARPAVPAPPAIPAAGGRKGRLMTRFDDFLDAAFWKFPEKSIGYTHPGGRK